MSKESNKLKKRLTEAERLAAETPPHLQLPRPESSSSLPAQPSESPSSILASPTLNPESSSSILASPPPNPEPSSSLPDTTNFDSTGEEDDNSMAYGDESGSQSDASTANPAPSVSTMGPAPPTSTPVPQSSGSSGSRRPWVSSILEPNTTPEIPANLQGSEDDMKMFEIMKILFANGLANVGTDKVPVRTPDKFDGSKPEKLEVFKGQCRMVFLGDEKKYNNSRKRALFAGSYLDGSAYDWWLQELRRSDADFRQTADNFWDILRERFGNPDHLRNVERQLTQLQMKDSDRVNRHIVSFDTLANQLEWNEPALRSRFELSLNTRLRDDLGRMDPAVMRSLATMKERVLALDRRYWERQDEVKRDRGKSGDSESHPRKSGNNSSSPPSSSSANASNSPPSSSSNQRDSSGRITAEERKRRMDNKLCLYCGEEGHGVRNCPVSEAKAKKRAAANSSKN